MAPRTLGSEEPRVRAKRIEPTLRLTVDSKTIGTPLSYRLAMDNISRTGLLLNVGRNHNVPFRVNTLVELTLDPHAQVLKSPVACIGKVVRLTLDAERKTQFGIQIVQMDLTDGPAWEQVLALLEERNKLLAAG